MTEAQKQWDRMKAVGLDVGALYRLGIKKFVDDLTEHIPELEKEMPGLGAWVVSEFYAAINAIEDKLK